jgi:hypothetical protein
MDGEHNVGVRKRQRNEGGKTYKVKWHTLRVPSAPTGPGNGREPSPPSTRAVVAVAGAPTLASGAASSMAFCKALGVKGCRREQSGCRRRSREVESRYAARMRAAQMRSTGIARIEIAMAAQSSRELLEGEGGCKPVENLEASGCRGSSSPSLVLGSLRPRGTRRSVLFARVLGDVC